ncbi:S-adenosyl-L-methionine dependent methyltransferase [Cubamyces sp. BRFM 1775]|nr:S-adenosyl-L-methionine dependent methyltransferase [Cubamyces sp. BRFM 1775]
MHSRNPYRTPPDFIALAEAYPSLKPHITLTQNGASIDFKNEAAQRLLTEAILFRDFALRVTLPPGRLCPPVPNRLNYILWLEDVMEAVSLALREPPNRLIRGLDVGTGASAIYPLLGCRTHAHWSFTATELDEISLRCARSNVEINGLRDRIAVTPAQPDGLILAPLSDSDAVYDFTMCNPPFYSSREEVLQSAEAKELGPNAVCTGADVEMITPGGETAFVGRMVDESMQLRGKCRWFTSMLGKMSSLTDIVQSLKSKQIDNYAISEFVQGQTRRWVIAWSASDLRLPDSLSRLSHTGMQNIMPARNTLHQVLPRTASVAQVTETTRSILTSVDGLELRAAQTNQSSDALDVVAVAVRNTWSRAARRKKRDAMHEDGRIVSDPQLVCRLRLEEKPDEGGRHGGMYLVFDWLRGRDRGLFESFASHIERKVVTTLSGGVR